jgi:hypothetical protein
MISRRTLAALIGVLLLLASPMAWGCDSVDTGVCQMSACPMSGAGSSMPGCHEGAGTSQDRGSLTPAAGACCQAPIDREPIDSAPAGQLDLSSSLLLAEVVQSRVEERLEPLVSSDATIASQGHELGRYTLLSSFLI